MCLRFWWVVGFKVEGGLEIWWVVGFRPAWNGCKGANGGRAAPPNPLRFFQQKCLLRQQTSRFLKTQKTSTEALLHTRRRKPHETLRGFKAKKHRKSIKPSACKAWSGCKVCKWGATAPLQLFSRGFHKRKRMPHENEGLSPKRLQL